MISKDEKARTREKHVRAFVRDNVRAGLLAPDELLVEVELAIREELPWLDVTATRSAWLREEAEAWAADALHWPPITDHDRLQDAFADLEAGGVAVLQGCEDHWAARDALKTRTPSRGVAWFLPQDVWHAIDAGMLEVNVWHVSGANVAAGDDLVEFVIEVLSRRGLSAHFDEGRIEVSAFWQRRP